MFARVITAIQAGNDDFEAVVKLARRQLPHARQQPGFSGYSLLTDKETGQVVIISLWRTRKDMEAAASDRPDGIDDEGVAATGLTSMRLGT